MFAHAPRLAAATFTVALLASNSACETTTIPCPPEVDDNTSTGTYTYTTTVAAEGGVATSSDRIAVNSVFGFVSWGAPGEEAPVGIDVSGTVTDASGYGLTLDLRIPGVVNGATVQLSAGSTLCLNPDQPGVQQQTLCPPVTGTLQVNTLSAGCEAPCTESFAGTLNASATWSTGSFTLSMSLNEQDTLNSSTCTEEVGGRWCNGEPC
jgi:hypothetical protein